MYSDQRPDSSNFVPTQFEASDNAASLADASLKARKLLRQGIIIAKGGDKKQGRELLFESVRLDPQGEMAWLWLASLAETPEDSISYLQRVLDINPTHEQAVEWIKQARRNLAQSLLARGVAAAKEGAPKAARTLLSQVVEIDPSREVAWLWLASVTEELEEKLTLLQRALALNPSNEQTQTSLQRVQASLDRARSQQEAEATGNEDQTPRDMAAQASTTTTEVQAPNWETPVTEVEQPAAQLEQPAAEVERPAEVSQPAPADSRVSASAFNTLPQTTARTILVVDDSPTVRKLIAIKLEKEGHRVVPAVDGKDALAKLNDVMPDLILTDITMPRMDGYQFCKLVRSDETTKHVPVIMLSGKDGFFDKVRGRMAGSTAYITKPFEPETLLKVVNDYCRSANN